MYKVKEKDNLLKLGLVIIKKVQIKECNKIIYPLFQMMVDLQARDIKKLLKRLSHLNKQNRQDK